MILLLPYSDHYYCSTGWGGVCVVPHVPLPDGIRPAPRTGAAALCIGYACVIVFGVLLCLLFLLFLSKAPKGNGIGATGSENQTQFLEPGAKGS